MKQEGYIQFFHSFPYPIDIFCRDTLLIEELPKHQLSNTYPLPFGIHSVTIRNKQTILYSGNFPLYSKNNYLLIPTTNQVCISLLNAPHTPLNESTIQFIHLTENYPSVDIAVTNGDTLLEQISFLGISDVLSITPMIIDLELRLTGTKEVIKLLPKSIFLPNKHYLIILNNKLDMVILQQDSI